MTVDIGFRFALVSNLTFHLQTMGALTDLEVLGVVCEGSFEFVESTPDTTPPALVSVVVEDTGDQITLTFDRADVSITSRISLSMVLMIRFRSPPTASP